MAGNRAPSCNMWYDDRMSGDILINHVMVPTSGTGVGTYYCALQWNGGRNGGGYCGIQDHPEGRCFIYSIWDPIGTNKAIEAVHQHSGTKVERFGGEGTGLKSMNFSIGWEPDTWYALVTRRWNYKGHTRFGFWVHCSKLNEWYHLVTMDFPLPDVTFDTQTACFIEDWIGTGEVARRVVYGNGYKRKLDGTWFRFNNSKFHVVQEDACRLYNDNYDGGTEDGCFYMQTGGTTCPRDILASDRCMCVGQVTDNPSLPEIRYTILDSSETGITWETNSSSTPQFKFKILVNDEEVQEDIDCDKQTCTFRNVKAGSSIQIALEDILGRSHTCTCHVTRNTEVCLLCCFRRW